MTLLYRPVKIVSAEQAEALPDGVALIRDGHFAFQKHEGRFVSADPHDLPTGYAWEVVGWSALVPIEAEEIWGIADADGTTYRAQSEEHARRWQKTMGTALAQRYITPWQEADQ